MKLTSVSILETESKLLPYYSTNRKPIPSDSYYNAYLQFFSHIVLDKGAAATLEEYIFSPKMNVAVNNAASAQMLNRFMAGLLHPLIHIGYGLEFGLLGIVAEGKAVEIKTAPFLIFVFQV